MFAIGMQIDWKWWKILLYQNYHKALNEKEKLKISLKILQLLCERHCVGIFVSQFVYALLFLFR